jgi:hypothetical protein
MRFIRDLMISAQGGDPQARQALTNFMSFDNPVEGSNLATRKDVQRVVYFTYVGMSFFPDVKNDPFTDAAEIIATVSKAKGGFKSNQTVELFRTSPDMAALKQSIEDIQSPSIRDRIFGRGKSD